MKYQYILVFTWIMLAACGSSRKTAKNSINLDEITINANDGEYRAAAERIWDITHTRVAISFNYKEKTASGKAWIDIKPYFYPSDTIRLDAQSMEIDTVLVYNMHANYTYADDVLTISLGKKYTKEDTIQIYVAYTAEPYKSVSGGSDAIRDDKGLYFVNTDNRVPELPVQIWTQGETQANSHWVPTIDKPNERFTTQIEMTVPNEYKTLSNGKLIEQINTSSTLRTDIWKTEKEIQPYVMTMVVGDYTVVEDKAWNGKTINYYVEDEYAPYAKEIFNHTPEMVDFFSKVTGVPYPWHKYSQVVVRDFVSGAMENTSASTFGEFVNQTSKEIKDNDHENVVAHELFHQWFGDYVTAESWSNITLNESFANYGEQLWRNYKYGKANAQELWYEDLSVYLSAAHQSDPPLARYHYKSREDLFDRTSYQKGGAILHYLHSLMGDEAFSLSMKQYLTDNALQPAEVDNWRMAIEKVTGQDWNWFFEQWYMHGGHPELAVSYEYNDEQKEVRITFNQKQEGIAYRLPFYVTLADGINRKEVKVDIQKTVETITLPYPGNTRPVVYTDSKHWIVGVVTEDKTTAEWVRHFQLTEKGDFATKVKAVVDNQHRIGNKDISSMYKLALKDELYMVRLYALNSIIAAEGNGLKNDFQETVLNMAEHDPSHHVRAACFSALDKWEVDNIYPVIDKGLADESFLVNASALLALNTVNHDSAYTVAKEYFKQTIGGQLKSSIWLVIGDEASADDTTLINSYQYKMRGRKKIDFAEGLYSYIINTSNDDAFKNVSTLMTELALNESIGSYRQSITAAIFSAAFFYKDEMQNAGLQQDAKKAAGRFSTLLAALEFIKSKESDEGNSKIYSTYLKRLKLGI